MAKITKIKGTGFSGRAKVIRKYCKKNMEVLLKRDIYNEYDDFAIAVYIITPNFWGLFGRGKRQIGFIESNLAKKLCEQINSGVKVTGVVSNCYAPEGREHPNVSIALEYE